MNELVDTLKNKTSPINKRPLLVKKFGGTSVGSIERIEALADRLVKDMKKEDRFPVVVVSAMAGETNRLVSLAYDIMPQYRGPAYDMLLASGEQVSVALLSIALAKRGVQAAPLLAFQLGIKTDSLHSKARILKIDTDKIHSAAAAGQIPIIAGFQGLTDDDQITTLGRGGSDTTAVAVAAALGEDICEIFTDVPAVFTADPRLVPKAREIKKVSFGEMMEMANLGSKVLHVRCVELAAKFGVRIHVRSSFEEREGTYVVREEDIVEEPVVSALAHEDKTVVIKLHPLPKGPKTLAQFFRRVADRGIVVDIITQSETEKGQRLAFSIPEGDLFAAEDEIKKYFGEIGQEIIKDQAKISSIGVGMSHHPGVAATFFEALAKIDVEIHLVTTSDIKISAVIHRKDLQRSLEQLHKDFSLENT